jgi:hypothetical protein
VKVAVKHKLLKSTRHVPDELLEQDDFGGCEIRANYSQNCAYLWTASGETYPISTPFPAFMKKGVKQAGEPSTATAAACAGGAAKRQRVDERQSGFCQGTAAGSVMALPPPEEVLREERENPQGEEPRAVAPPGAGAADGEEEEEGAEDEHGP